MSGQSLLQGGNLFLRHIAGVVFALPPALELVKWRRAGARGLWAEFAPLHAGDGVHFLQDLLTAVLSGHANISSMLDMESQKNQREVENTLRDALHADRARVQTGKISRFGLLELSRQRMRPSLGETNHAACPRCSGTGHIRGIESTALHILRITQEEAMKDNSAIIQVQLPVEAATFLLNEKRADIHKIEQRMGVEVVLIPNIHMETPNYSITRIKLDDVNEENAKPSYNMVEIPAETAYVRSLGEEAKPSAPEALVKGIRAGVAAPIVEDKPAAPVAKVSFLGRIKKWLGASGEVKPESKTEENNTSRDNNRDRDRNRNANGNRNNRDRNNRDRNNQNNRDRGDKPQQAQRPQQQARPDRPPRPENNQQNRNEPRADKVESAVPAIAQGNVAADGTSAQPRERSRRSRGGRNRNKNRDANRDINKDVIAESAPFVPNEAVEQSAPIAKPAPAPKPAPKPKTEHTEKPAVAETVVAVTVAESSPAEKPAAAEKVSKAKPKAPAKKPKPAKPVDLAASGLQLVETKNEAKAAVKVAEPAKPRAPRKAPNWKKGDDVTKADAPLVMVETQK